jgi:hypothetical protein
MGLPFGILSKIRPHGEDGRVFGEDVPGVIGKL